MAARLFEKAFGGNGTRSSDVTPINEVVSDLGTTNGGRRGGLRSMLQMVGAVGQRIDAARRLVVTVSRHAPRRALVAL